MKVFVEFEKTVMGQQIIIEELIKNFSLFNFSWLKNFINNKVVNNLQSLPYNGQILNILSKEIESNNEIFFLVRPNQEQYCTNAITQLKKDLEYEIITPLVGENFQELIETASEQEEYHFIGSSIFQYNYFIDANKISFNSDFFSYIILYIIFFNKIKYCYNNYLHGMFAILFNYRYIFFPLLIFWPVCFGINVNKLYILPLFKSVSFSLMCFSLIATLERIDYERYMLQQYDMEPLCDMGFVTQRYSISIAILYIIMSLLLAIKDIIFFPLPTCLGVFIGILHYLMFFKGQFARVCITAISFIISNVVCMYVY